MKSIEDSLIALLQIRKDHDEIGISDKQKFILGKLKGGSKIKDWRALAVKLELSPVEVKILEDSLETPKCSVIATGVMDSGEVIRESCTRWVGSFIKWRLEPVEKCCVIGTW